MNVSTIGFADSPRRPRVRIYYHVFHPSDNVSARHVSDLAAGLAERGWDVTACPANRGYPDGSIQYRADETWNNVRIQRVWRPKWPQSRNLGRLANAAWMILAWSAQAISRGKNRPDAVIIGTDPILSALTALPWKMTRPKVVVAHWGFDLYPEAPIAEGMIAPRSPLTWVLRKLLTAAYRVCDLIVDIGPCMRELLQLYGSKACIATLTPWALVEPKQPVEADLATRRQLFGDAALGLLYSGTFGRAHSYEEFLTLARSLRGTPISFCFAGRGNRAEQLRQAVTTDDTNIRFAGFASEAELEKRLGAADIHLASLRNEWTGSVVPSKFFGSLAVGRPVLFAGATNSALAQWIRLYGVGWHLNADSMMSLADELRSLASSPTQMRQMQQHCHGVYRQHFSRDRVIDGWDRELRNMLRTPKRAISARTPAGANDMMELLRKSDVQNTMPH